MFVSCVPFVYVCMCVYTGDMTVCCACACKYVCACVNMCFVHRAIAGVSAIERGGRRGSRAWRGAAGGPDYNRVTRGWCCGCSCSLLQPPSRRRTTRR